MIKINTNQLKKVFCKHILCVILKQNYSKNTCSTVTRKIMKHIEQQKAL